MAFGVDDRRVPPRPVDELDRGEGPAGAADQFDDLHTGGMKQARRRRASAPVWAGCFCHTQSLGARSLPISEHLRTKPLSVAGLRDDEVAGPARSRAPATSMPG